MPDPARIRAGESSFSMSASCARWRRVPRPMLSLFARPGVLQWSIAEGSAIAEGQVEPSELLRGFNDARHTLQHPKLPFMSRPYEWRFTALKHAARLHLDVQIRCLEQNVTLSDASAYNVQFEGPKPIFIGSLPFRHYHEGEFWIGTSTSASNLSILSCFGRCSGSVATRGSVAASKAPERRHRVRAQVRPAGSASASAKGGHLRRLFRGDVLEPSAGRGRGRARRRCLCERPAPVLVRASLSGRGTQNDR